MSAKRVTADWRDKSSGVTDTSSLIRSRFVESMARLHVPEIGARAVLRQITALVNQVNDHKLSPDRAVLKVLQAVDKAKRRGDTLERRRIRALAAEFKAGAISMMAIRDRLRGAA